MTYPAWTYNGAGFFEIVEGKPFWRYAVAPANKCSPGIPFYTRKGSDKLFIDAITRLPKSGVLLFRRHNGELEVISEYTPDE